MIFVTKKGKSFFP